MVAWRATMIEIRGSSLPHSRTVLTQEALDFLADLHRRFNPRREELLRRRQERQARIEGGEIPGFLEATRLIRETEWRVADAPRDLQRRRVEITGPVERKMMINALNSGADVFMADFEDSLSPTWENVVEGQANLIDAVRRELSFTSPEGKEYRLRDELATLVVRPRGWHLPERHVLVDGEPVSASLFDFGLFFFHNARELMERGSGPYFYLPKLESHLEARLWNDVFRHAQERLGIPVGTIRATVLIETILAAFEMDEILHELREHAAGLNAGRWDHIFSVIKKFRARPDRILPDRGEVTMRVPFMAAYCNLLVMTCHRRGAHAIGGMSAFIPSRKDPEVNRVALEQVRADKDREVSLGFDGTWVAHPDLVPVAREPFDRVFGGRPNQKERMPPMTEVSARELLDTRIEGAGVTEGGVRQNIDVALQYLDSWLCGTGAAAIHNLMEDAATAEISRSELWQWLHHRATLEDGRAMSADLYAQVRDEVLRGLRPGRGRLDAATDLLNRLVLERDFPEFLTLVAYPLLDSIKTQGEAA
jgi:malate synthase